MTVRKKRVIIIFIWLVSLVLFYFVSSSAAFAICKKNSIREFIFSVKSISDVVPSFIENDDYTKGEIRTNHEARLNGLAMALEDVEEIENAEAFLKEFKAAGGIEAIVVYDENEKPVYNDGFKDEDGTASGDVYSVKSGDRWLVKIKDGYTDTERDLEFLNNWSRKLSNVIIGESGCLLAVDPENDEVLSFNYGIGSSLEDLDIRYEGSALDYEAFRELFGKPDQVHKIRIGDRIMYGTRVRYEKMYLLALLPEEEILYDVRNIVINLMIVLALFTGLVMSFLLFTLTDALKEGDPSLYRHPSGKLLLGMIISLLLILFLSVWIGLLDMFAEKYRDCETKTDYISSKIEAIDTFEEMRKTYSEKEYLKKCLMAKTMIGFAERPLRTEDLDRISEGLGIGHISVYDENGRPKLTNSPFIEKQITQDSDLYPLLNGRYSMVLEPCYDNVSDSFMQYIGASLMDDLGAPDGFVRIEMDLTKLKDIQHDIGFDNIIRQGCLSEGSFLALIDTETGKFKNAALIEKREDSEAEGQFDSFSVEDTDHDRRYNSYTYYLLGEEDINLKEDYTNLTLEEAGFKDEVLRPDYSGIQTIREREYYARSERIWDDICLVMREKDRIGPDNIIPAILTAVTAFISMLLMLIVFVQPGNALEEEQHAEGKAHTKGTIDKDSFAVDDFLAMFSSLLDSGKPYFEVRWPDDSASWSDKDASGKLRSVVRGIILAIVLLIIIQQWFFNSIDDDSIWYYVLSPRWNGSIDVITLTRSGIAVITIIAVSCVIHKLLFYVARASGPHVETICHLLNSFIKYASFITGIFYCLSIFGVNMGVAFSISAGVVSVIISIACQSIVADIFAGIFMVFEGTVTAGEFVHFNDRYGAILSVGIRTTQIIRFSEVMVVRNSEFKNYVNVPANERDRMTVSIYIDFNEPLARVESIIFKELKDMHRRLVELTGDEDLLGPEYRGIQRFTDNGVALEFAIYAKGFYYGWINRELNRELKMMFERNNIRIAMPQIVVNEPADHDEVPVTDNYPTRVPDVLEQQEGSDPKDINNVTRPAGKRYT